MDLSKGDGCMDENLGLPAEGPYDPRKDQTLTKQAWRYIKRIKYDYYLMDKEVLEIIEKRDKAKQDNFKADIDAILMKDIDEQNQQQEVVNDDVDKKDEEIVEKIDDILENNPTDVEECITL